MHEERERGREARTKTQLINTAWVMFGQHQVALAQCRHVNRARRHICRHTVTGPPTPTQGFQGTSATVLLADQLMNTDTDTNIQ